jgi:hypothetical protein
MLAPRSCDPLSQPPKTHILIAEPAYCSSYENTQFPTLPYKQIFSGFCRLGPPAATPSLINYQHRYHPISPQRLASPVVPCRSPAEVSRTHQTVIPATCLVPDGTPIEPAAGGHYRFGCGSAGGIHRVSGGLGVSLVGLRRISNHSYLIYAIGSEGRVAPNRK